MRRSLTAEQRARQPTLRAYTEASPLLLVTAFSPAHQGGGAVILRSLVGEHGAPNVVWASLAEREVVTAGRVAHRRSGRSAWLSAPNRMAQAIDRVADRHGASAIWIVAHGPILPAVAPLVERFGRPVHLSVHDDPAWAVVFRTRRELPLTPWVRASLSQAVAAATSVDVISAGMRAEFARRFEIDSVVVHRVIDEPIPANEAYDRRSAGLSVGILGKLYAPRQLELLLRAVSRAAERARVPGRVVLVGQEDARLVKRAAAVGDVEVTFTGHLPEHDGVEILRRVFALYLGYPFGLRAQVLRRTSFPTKLGTYLLAARPLFLHTPYDSTLTPIASVAPFTIPWLDDNVERGARSLLRAWVNDVLHASQHEPAELLRTQHFGLENRARMFEALDRLP